MAWFRVDDKFPRHPKVVAAARHLGGRSGRILAVWMEAGCYCSEHSTDGFISELVAKSFLSDRKPIEVLDVLAFDDVRLMYRVDGGFQFHDWLDYNPSAESVKAKREADRARKRGVDSNRNPDGIRAESGRIPKRSRARVPTRPLPFRKDQDPALRLCGIEPHLLKAGHDYIEGHPDATEADVLVELKVIARRCGVPQSEYTSAALQPILDKLLSTRMRRGQKVPA